MWRKALAVIEQELPQARTGTTLAALAEYFRARQPYIPNYRDRWRALHHIGSGQLEKANNLLVARRQRGHSRHWSAQTNDTLAAAADPEAERREGDACWLEAGTAPGLTEGT